eukprot:2737817-Pyramimonas_sp.AAC.2
MSLQPCIANALNAGFCDEWNITFLGVPLQPRNSSLQAQYEETVTMLARASDEAFATERDMMTVQSDLSVVHDELDQIEPELVVLPLHVQILSTPAHAVYITHPIFAFDSLH